MRMTPQREAALKDLENGATFIVTITNEAHLNNIIEIQGGGRHSDGVVQGLFHALREENRLQVVDNGLFEGCGQTYKLVL